MPKTDKNPIFQTGAQKVMDMARAANAQVRKRPRVAIIAGAAALVVIGLGVTVAVRGMPDLKVVDTVESKIGAKQTLAELQKAAREQPKNATAQMELAHAYFDAKQYAAALRYYDIALSLDPSLVSSRVTSNVLACYGTNFQGTAYTVLTKHKMVGAEDDLRKMTGDKRYIVRSGAVATLEKLGKVKHDDYVNAYLADLNEENCDVRRHAVEKLGDLGDKRALAAIKAAGKHDEEKTSWWQFSCLGGRAIDAEKKILAHR